MRPIVVAMTGSTGAIFGVRLLEALHQAKVDVHLILSKWAERTIEHETTYTVDQVRSLATVVHSAVNQAASISSGSFRTAGMVVAPCSMKTLAAIAHGFGESLIPRAADVVLKEKRKLVLVTREMPLSAIHLENMLKLANMGAVMMPPMPAFYNHPTTLDDMVNHIVGRILDQFDIDVTLAPRWSGEMRRLASQ